MKVFYKILFVILITVLSSVFLSGILFFIDIPKNLNFNEILTLIYLKKILQFIITLIFLFFSRFFNRWFDWLIYIFGLSLGFNFPNDLFFLTSFFWINFFIYFLFCSLLIFLLKKKMASDVSDL